MPKPNTSVAAEPWLGPIADLVPDGLVLVDDDGGTVLANSAAVQLLHASTEEAFELAARELVDALGDRERADLVAHGDRPALVVKRGMPSGVPASGCLLVLRDATKMSAADVDLLLANRMRGIENLYRAMAHDLKSPLQAIVLNLDLLRQLVTSGDVDETVEVKVCGYLDVIQGEISRLGRTIQTLLSQARPGVKRKRRVDLRRIQREIVTLLEPVARRKGARLHSALPTRSVTVLGNRDRIKQALLNLAVNALEAMDRRGVLEFELGVDGSSALVEIRDDGPGIPEALRGKVFDAHFSTKKTGTGIGLGVARSVARAHGGDLELLPRQPRGTIARLQLPLVERQR